ncbi:MAG: hypothetical protein PHW31_03910 [Candidatus Pacebacteria bacterium]|nr:hypothetical protein [Candidatus Paceibacterota bacterium]
MKIKKEQFLPAITTLSAKFVVEGNSWQDKIKEIGELGLKKAAIFPTCLDKNQRQEMYELLEKTGLKEIPFVHLRSDMSPEELEYLIKKFNTQAFNIHTEKQWPLDYDLLKYKPMIFVENAGFPLQTEEIEKFGGICLDFSHMENDRILFPERFKTQKDLLKKHKIGCNHIAAIGATQQLSEDGTCVAFDKHIFNELSEFDYLKNYPFGFFSNYTAIEVENSLSDQLKAIDYICKILNN